MLTDFSSNFFCTLIRKKKAVLREKQHSISLKKQYIQTDYNNSWKNDTSWSFNLEGFGIQWKLTTVLYTHVRYFKDDCSLLS
jgi:hypothetical protein